MLYKFFPFVSLIYTYVDNVSYLFSHDYSLRSTGTSVLPSSPRGYYSINQKHILYHDADYTYDAHLVAYTCYYTLLD